MFIHEIKAQLYFLKIFSYFLFFVSITLLRLVIFLLLLPSNYKNSVFRFVSLLKSVILEEDFYISFLFFRNQRPPNELFNLKEKLRLLIRFIKVTVYRKFLFVILQAMMKLFRIIFGSAYKFAARKSQKEKSFIIKF